MLREVKPNEHEDLEVDPLERFREKFLKLSPGGGDEAPAHRTLALSSPLQPLGHGLQGAPVAPGGHPQEHLLICALAQRVFRRERPPAGEHNLAPSHFACPGPGEAYPPASQNQIPRRVSSPVGLSPLNMTIPGPTDGLALALEHGS